MSQVRIVEQNYFEFFNALRAASDNGSKIEPRDKEVPSFDLLALPANNMEPRGRVCIWSVLRACLCGPPKQVVGREAGG